MEWTQDKPKKAGIYLRSNPPLSAIVRDDVFVGLDGSLKISRPGDALFNATRLASVSDRFWWYGPIPQPPWKQSNNKAKEKP